MTKPLNIGILFGGKSTEHEISLLSARSVIQAMDKNKYLLTLIGIDHQGKWHLVPDENFSAIKSANPLALLPGHAQFMQSTEYSQQLKNSIDVIFPVLHGACGEDGSIQGLLKLIDIPFVGAGILDSAIGMDKDVSKRLLREAGIQIPAFLVFHYFEQNEINFNAISSQLKLPFFVKPANTGSSIGVSKVHTQEQFNIAIATAFKYDTKIIIEQYIAGKEIECAVLGNHQPIASILGEIIPHHEFYSYEAKYLDKDGATLQIPAQIDEEKANQIRALAVKVFKVLCCHGMARVDFFLREDGQVFVNEINTIPGFTSISMYPKLWQATGLSYSDLLDKLIELAIEQHQHTSQLNSRFLTAN